jgi:hypothetical protein
MSNLIDTNVPIVGQEKRRTAKVKVLVCSHDVIPATFAADLTSLVMFTTAALPQDGGTQFGSTFRIGTYIHTARQQELLLAIEEEVDFLLWLDSDMRFPRDLLTRLLQHKLPLVGINYSTRRLPPDYVAIKKLTTALDEPSVRLATLPESTGVEEVDAIGFGAFLMRMDVMRNMPPVSQQQWFGHEYMPEREQWVGEDVLFCRLLREKGHRIFVDHDLTKECAHTGFYDFTVGDVWAYAEAVAEEKRKG